MNSKLRSNIIISVNPDIICLNETHLIDNNEIILEGYQWYGNNRSLRNVKAKRGSGGVGILIKDDLFNTFIASVTDKSHDGILCMDLKHRMSDFVISIICVYLPPEYSPWGRDSASFFAQLSSAVYASSNSDMLLICGDFNARIGNMDDFIIDVDELTARESIDNVKNKHGEALIEFLKDMKMCIINGRLNSDNDNFTCISTKGKSVVDYFLTLHSNLKHCQSFQVFTISELIDDFGLQYLISSKSKPPDHSLLCLEITFSMSNLIESDEPESVPVNSNSPRYNFTRNTDQAFLSAEWVHNINTFINERQRQLVNQEKVDEMYYIFCALLTSEMDKYFRCDNAKASKKRLRISKPFWNDELANLWKRMKASEREYLQACKRKLCKNVLFKLKTTFTDSRNLFDKTFRRLERSYNRQHVDKIESLNTDNPSDFWKHINKLGPQNKNKNIPMKVKLNDDYVTNEKVVLEKWKEDFSRLYNAPNTNDFDDNFLNVILEQKLRIESNLTETNDYINRSISYDEIENIIMHLKNKKSVGIDNIPNEVLKNKDVIITLWKLFNIYFESGLSPSVWQKSVIKPIPKNSKKDKCVPLNYRGISLQSCIYKTYSAFLNNRINDYCELLDIIVDEQNGFRKKRSCEDHIFTLTSVLQNKLNEKKSVYAAFIDLEKAFDWVHRDLLLYRLLQYNIDGKMYWNVKGLYRHNESCMKLNNVCTDWFTINSGVKQGDNISPTLFSLYINELATEIKNQNKGVTIGNTNVSILLYADDMVLVSENESDLQCLLDTMYDWCKKWRLKVNLEKTNIVHFRPKKFLKSSYQFSYGAHLLDYANQYKYLGTYIDEHLTFETCSKTLAESGGRALSAVISKFKEFKESGFKTFSKLYDACVVPVCDYGSGVWGYKDTNNHAELVQNKAIRYFLGVHNFTPIAGLQSEMGWTPSKYRKQINLLRFWNRVVKMPDDRLTKKIFNHNFNVENNWNIKVKEILRELNEEDKYMQKMPCNLNECESKLQPLIESEWKTQSQNKPKLRTYLLFKDKFETSSYLIGMKNRVNRSLYAKFRLGILQLEVESGRFNQTPLEERICKLCNLNAIENELHFLCTCPQYAELRQGLYNYVSMVCPEFNVFSTIEKFKFLLSNDNFTKNVITYLSNAWRKRKSILFT